MAGGVCLHRGMSWAELTVWWGLEALKARTACCWGCSVRKQEEQTERLRGLAMAIYYLDEKGVSMYVKPTCIESLDSNPIFPAGSDLLLPTDPQNTSLSICVLTRKANRNDAIR